MNRCALALIAGSLVFLAPAVAIAQLPIGKQNCETAVDAAKVSDDQKTGQVTASGNVIVTQCDTKLHADSIVYEKNSQKITANGHLVVISQRGAVASGDAGVYEVLKKLVTLTGHVVIKQGGNVASGTRGTYNVATGIAQLDAGNPNGSQTSSTTSDGRVHAILSPSPPKGN